MTFALKTTAARVEERCRELRCGTADSVAEANRSHASRSLHIRRDLSRGTMTITVELPLEAGELIDKALDKAREASIAQGPEFAEESWAAQQADALVTMAKSYLSGTREASSAASDNYQVTVHVDRSALSDGRGRSGLPIESVRRLCCDGETVVIVEDEHGEPLNVGRKTRTVPTAIKRALWSRDKGCVFPGCTHKRFVDAHPVRLNLLPSAHWRLRTDIYCTKDQFAPISLPLPSTQANWGGFSIAKDYLDHRYFRRPDGIAVPHCGYRAEDTLDDDIDTNGVMPELNPSAEGYPSAEGLPALPLNVAERSPPAYLM